MGKKKRKKKITLREALENFLLVDRAEETNRGYRKILEDLIEFLGPDRRLSSVEPEEIDAWFRQMRAQTERYLDHPKRPAQKGKLSDATLANRDKTARAFFNWTVRRKYIKSSPMETVDKIKYRRKPTETKAMSPADFVKLLEATQHNHLKLSIPRNKAIVLFLTTSCRRKGACSLRISNLTLCGGWGYADLIEKGDKPQQVIFGPEVEQALIDWLAVRPEMEDHDFVFTDVYTDEPLTPQGLTQMVGRLAKKAGIEDRPHSPHAIRHMVGQYVSDKNEPVKVVQMILGHVDPKITYETYYGVDQSRLEKLCIGLTGSILREGERQNGKNNINEEDVEDVDDIEEPKRSETPDGEAMPMPA